MSAVGIPTKVQIESLWNSSQNFYCLNHKHTSIFCNETYAYCTFVCMLTVMNMVTVMSDFISGKFDMSRVTLCRN